MGCKFTFTHCADLHLGSRFWGVYSKDPDRGRKMYESTFSSFSRIVDVSIQRSDFMVISGDVYDEAVETPRTRMRFAKELERFGKPCFIVRGNHDFKNTWSSAIPYPENVTEIGDSPESHVLEINGQSVEIVGVSYSQGHTTENLASRLRGNRDMFTIGMVHCSVKDIAEGDVYAPCSLKDFLGMGVDYWALGHIHKRTVLMDSYPVAIYPGNIQGRNPKETGEKGCYIVTVDRMGVNPEFVPTQAILWKDVEIDISGLKDLNALVSLVRSEAVPGCVLSISMKGRSALDHVIRKDKAGLEEYLSDSTGSDISIRSLNTRSPMEGDGDHLNPMVQSVEEISSRYSGMSEQELLDLLCSKGPASDLRPYLGYYAEKGMLRKLVESAKLSLIDRMVGEDR